MTYPAIEQQARLAQREADLREAGRQLELDPRRRKEADGLFRRASALRETRLRLARRCGLL